MKSLLWTKHAPGATSMTGPIGVASLGAKAAIAAMLLYVFVGVAFGLSTTLTAFLELSRVQFSKGGIASLQAGMAVVLAGVAGFWSWTAARRDRPYSVPIFLIGLVVISLGIRAALVLGVDSQWSTDYLRYWQHASGMAAADVFEVRNLYDQRALLVAYPVAQLFGPDAHLTLKLVNVTLLVGVQLMAYDLMRRATSHQTAQAMSVLFLAAPMPAYVSLIPSHDLWGLFFLTCAVWAACSAMYLLSPKRQWTRIMALGLFCALATYALELQRTIGTLFALTLCLAAVLALAVRSPSTKPGSKNAHRAGNLLAVSLICLAMQPPLTMVGTHLGIHPANEIVEQSSHKMKFAAHAGAMGTATSDWYARFRDRFDDKAVQSPESTAEFAQSLALSTLIVQPQGKLLHFAAHMPRMFDMGYPADWDTALRQPTKISADTRAGLLLYAGAFGLVFGVMLAGSLIVSATSNNPLPPPVLIVVLFVAVLSFLLLVLFENKAPNIFPIWLAGSMTIAWVASFTRLSSADGAVSLSQVPSRSLKLLTTVALLAVVFSIAWLVVRAFYTEDDGRILANWELTLRQAASAPQGWDKALQEAPPRAFEAAYLIKERRGFVLRGAVTDGPRIRKYSGELFTILEFPAALSVGDQLSMQRVVCGATAGRGLEFFLFSPFSRPDVSDSFFVDVAVDGDVIRRLSIPLGGDNMQLVSIQDVIGDKQCHDISITVISNVARSAGSWRRASHVEIWFPRLVDKS